MIIPAPKTFEKLEELILCLTEKAPDIGITKLEKLLYFCDFEATKELGKSITEDTYRNFQWGPVPKHFIPAYENLLNRGRLEKKEIKLRSGKDFTQLTPREKCKAELFSKEEWAVIDRVLKHYGGKNAAELVTLTHSELTWKLTERNEEIPDFLAHYRHHEKPSAQEVDALLRDPDYIASIKSRLAHRAAR